MSSGIPSTLRYHTLWLRKNEWMQIALILYRGASQSRQICSQLMDAHATLANDTAKTTQTDDTAFNLTIANFQRTWQTRLRATTSRSTADGYTLVPSPENRLLI